MPARLQSYDATKQLSKTFNAFTRARWNCQVSSLKKEYVSRDQERERDKRQTGKQMQQSKSPDSNRWSWWWWWWGNCLTSAMSGDLLTSPDRSKRWRHPASHLSKIHTKRVIVICGYLIISGKTRYPYCPQGPAMMEWLSLNRPAPLFKVLKIFSLFDSLS